MNECLVTQLKGVVNNDSLLKLGELRFSLSHTRSSTVSNLFMILSDKANTVSLSETCTMSTSSDMSNPVTVSGSVEIPANTACYFNIPYGSTIDVSIRDKYSIRNLITNGYSYNFRGISFLTSLTGLVLFPSELLVLDSLKQKPATGSFQLIARVNEQYESIVFDAGELKFESIPTTSASIYLNSYKITGKFSPGPISFATTGAISLSVERSNVSFDPAIDLEIKNGKLRDLRISDSLVSGDLGALFAKLLSDGVLWDETTTVGLAARNMDTLSGDIARCPFAFFTNTDGSYNEYRQRGLSSFSWSIRPQGFILALEKVKLGNFVDAMLIDQATKELHPTAAASSWLKSIYVIGTRTAASDAAVQTLTDKGVTVTVTAG
ncbi:hypothetical protein GGR21_002450 [Dysgonomonas hofstadii]|uniref:Uncharacterized protein n=1 Tax=Dysgonomonas hofstadii TaxID=637886 RepID=A0A840CSB9_9BACT|nr:hypothetical protein [Dysgonomonas hofstadii]MBB4036544.1 hypothetical protein [Dysgonomonas hofstadii]